MSTSTDNAAAEADSMLHSASFWVAVLLLPLVYMLVASLIGLIGTADWSDDVRAGLSGSLIGSIIGGVVGYYFGQTTSRNRTPKP
jgi:membrane associated rhomboid family serine protease